MMSLHTFRGTGSSQWERLNLDGSGLERDEDVGKRQERCLQSLEKFNSRMHE